MIAINKQEKEAIRERFPDVYIVRTVKQKRHRHHYFCEEAKPVLRFLNELRGIVPEKKTNKRKDKANRGRNEKKR